MSQPEWPEGNNPLIPQSPFPAHLRASLPMNPEPLSVDMSMALIKRMIAELLGRGMLNPAVTINTAEDQHGMTIRVETG